MFRYKTDGSPLRSGMADNRSVAGDATPTRIKQKSSASTTTASTSATLSRTTSARTTSPSIIPARTTAARSTPSRGLRVLLISKYDFAGSGYRLSEAVSLTTRHHVQHLVLHPCPFPAGLARTPSLFKPDGQGGLTIQEDDLARVQTLVNQADLLHFKGDDPPSDDFIPGIRLPEDTPRVVTVSGKFFRRGASCVAEPMAPIAAYAKATLRTALTADLNYPEFSGCYTPQAYDISATEPTWHPRRIPLIAHSPSDRDKKGTSLLLAACELLRSRGVRFGLDIIENVSHAECLRRKGRASVFVDQLNEVGFYGNAALEAMAGGIPVVTHLSEQARAQSGGIIADDCPIVSSGTTAESLANALERVLASNLAELSARTRLWMERVHSYEAVGCMWDELYGELFVGKGSGQE